MRTGMVSNLDDTNEKRRRGARSAKPPSYCCGYSPLFQITASPSPVVFWTDKVPFWYTLAAPRPEETAHPLRSRQPPRGCAGQARRDAPTRNECRAHPERPRPALHAGLAAPPTPLRTCAQCFLGRTLSPPPSSPLPCVFLGGGRGEPTRGIDSPS